MTTETETIMQKQQDYVVPTYTPKIALVRGKGTRVWDSDGVDTMTVSPAGLTLTAPQFTLNVKTVDRLLARSTYGGADTVTVYDLFPLSALLDPRYRTVAGQFLAAEALWTLEEQGML